MASNDEKTNVQPPVRFQRIRMPDAPKRKPSEMSDAELYGNTRKKSKAAEWYARKESQVVRVPSVFPEHSTDAASRSLSAKLPHSRLNLFASWTFLLSFEIPSTQNCW